MNYGLSSKLSGVYIPYDLVRSKEFIEWTKNPEFRVWMFLHGSIVRAKMKRHKLGLYIFEKFYLNGHAVSWATQTKISNMLSYSDKSFVSRQIKLLKNKGIVIEHQDKFNGKRIKLYETAEVLSSMDQQEAVYAFAYFRQKNAEKKLSKFL